MTLNGKTREDLAQEANAVRGKLLHTIEQLDQRRHEALDLRLQLHRHMLQIATVGAVAIVATGLAVGLVVHRISTSADRRRQARWRLLATVWRHPERALRAERPPFHIEVLRSLGLSIISAAVGVPLRRAVTSLSEGATRLVTNGHSVDGVSTPAQAR